MEDEVSILDAKEILDTFNGEKSRFLFRETGKYLSGDNFSKFEFPEKRNEKVWSSSDLLAKANDGIYFHTEFIQKLLAGDANEFMVLFGSDPVGLVLIDGQKIAYKKREKKCVSGVVDVYFYISCRRRQRDVGKIAAELLLKSVNEWLGDFQVKNENEFLREIVDEYMAVSSKAGETISLKIVF